MKELSIKENSYDGNYKAYMELINRLEDIKNAIKKQNYGIAMDILCKPYPEFQITTYTELKESEAEKIRKLILTGLIDCRDAPDLEWSNFGGIPIDDCIAWLEKQGGQKPAIEMKSAEESLGIDSETYNKIVNECIYGEQKPADKVEPRFKIGDYVVGKYISGYISEVRDDCYLLDYQGFPIDKQDDYHLWTIQDAKDGDILSNGDSIVIFRGIGNEKWNDVIDYHIGLFTDSQHLVVQKNLSHWGRINEVTLHPATKEQCNLLFQKMKEAGYEWDAEKKELKEIIDEKQIKKNLQDNSFRRMFEQNSAWSEEDEHWRQKAIDFMKHPDLIKATPTLAKDTIDWLKSLRPQNRWKPSDELDEASYRVGVKRVLENPESYGLTKNNLKPSEGQMEALKEACDEHWEADGLDPLYTLYQDLMKLREELV